MKKRVKQLCALTKEQVDTLAECNGDLLWEWKVAQGQVLSENAEKNWPDFLLEYVNDWDERIGTISSEEERENCNIAYKEWLNLCLDTSPLDNEEEIREMRSRTRRFIFYCGYFAANKRHEKRVEKPRWTFKSFYRWLNDSCNGDSNSKPLTPQQIWFGALSSYSIKPHESDKEEV